MKKKVFIGVGIVLLIILIILCYFLFRKEFKVKEFEKEIDVSYKEEWKSRPGSICYGNVFSCREVSIKEEGTVDVENLGDYTVTYHYEVSGKQKTLTQIVHVKDLKAPEITLPETALVCPNGKIKKFEFSVMDDFDENLKEEATIEVVDHKIIVSVKDHSGNEATKEMEYQEEDLPPEITLNGSETESFLVGNGYEDKGANVIDDCDDVVLQTENGVNPNEEGTYYVTYKAVDSKNQEASKTRTVKAYQTPPLGTKTIYLTFDDGPSYLTYGLLDVLAKYNVKATFFVTLNGDDAAIERAYREGHAIGLHTASHDYSYIYANADNFFADLNRVSERVERITGEKSTLMRFAGGSSNTTSAYYDGGTHIMSYLTDEVERRGYTYFDWNVSSGDAGGTTDSGQVYWNVVSHLKSGSSVVLQHDVKSFSVAAVEDIIIYGINNGYRFEKLNPYSPTAHHGVNN